MALATSSATGCSAWRKLVASIWILTASGGVLVSPGIGRAQMVDNPVFGNFEINTAGSVEQDLLNQIRLSGRVSAEDFPRLTRLIMLEAYAMHQNVRGDLRTSEMGAALENQTVALLNSAANLDAYVRANAGLDPSSMDEPRERLSDTLEIYRTIDGSLGQLPAFSPNAARHLGDMTQLLSVVNAVVGSTAEPVGGRASGPLAVTGNSELEGLRRLASALVAAIERWELGDEARRKTEGAGPTIGEDRRLIARLAREFQSLLAVGPTMPDVADTWRVIRTRMWEFERRIGEQTEHREWRVGWLAVRRGFDAISQQLRFPRVIMGFSAAAGSQRTDIAALERTDQALVAVLNAQKVLERRTSGARIDPLMVDELGRLRVKLLQVRIAILAGATLTRSSTLVREIDRVDRTLWRRAMVSSSRGRVEHVGQGEELRALHRLLVGLREPLSQ